jgi:hypothetical protein
MTTILYIRSVEWQQVELAMRPGATPVRDLSTLLATVSM